MIEQQLLSVENHFTNSIYWIDKKEYLPLVSKVSEEYLNVQRKANPVNKVFPAYMTESFDHDVRIRDFVNYIAASSWNILDEQGFNMDIYEVFIQEFWAQEHYFSSSMNEHIHGLGSQISGFYVLEAPENSSKLVINDPRPGKRQIDLLERDMNELTFASKKVFYTPVPGYLYFTNSWLPHEFTRNISDSPVKFIHFNVGARYKAVTPVKNTEFNVIPTEIV